MTYERLAYVYDFLMKDVPYYNWLDFLSAERKRYSVEGNRVLDLACGTGELSVLLAEEGFDVTGVDLSGDMLMVAREKAEQKRLQVHLFEQDMSLLEGLGTFDIITIFCDSLNYLQRPEEVQKTFSNVFTHLNEDGLFLFDVHSPYKINEFINETYSFAEDEVSYIWTSFPGEHSLSIEHELTFFVLDEKTGKYDRFDELHKQRTYSTDQYSDWLTKANFIIKSITADFSNQAPTNMSERLFFTCKKNKALS
ncbi:class I SAM-dependent DNA methyltransferase [Lederbergia panacisoli]|uniref:class I SAM-dependent DNA methyltransferase n=1 Tax=Lederbergia panacisoli TaxID=1255251 RepID=UPI00214CBEBE|nr:class I SAM-dependent methyltransferase [Lederbergia panacisoli]MCR2820465.1 class I SAM-dependent methyltransferase [Lederbergia panacisoli]